MSQLVPQQLPAFDLADYIRHPHQVRAEDLDLAAIGELPAPAVLALQHALAVEDATLTVMRDLLLTPTHAEATVTAFLTTWAYEKYWLAQALRQVLADQPAPAPSAPGPGLRLRAVVDERLRPMIDAIVTNLQGEQVVAGHMVTGLLDTLVTRLTFTRLAELAPPLTLLSNSVRAVTDRHVAFYTEQSQQRLRADAGARRSAQHAVRRWRWPGTALADPDRSAEVLRYLLRGSRARAQVLAVDEHVATLGCWRHGYTPSPVRTEFGRFVVRGTTGA